MFSACVLLMLNSLFFSLRLSGGGGSFPRPLKAEEERMYLERMAQGDMEARNTLIEHNLRLVAHIIKKYYTQSGDQDDLISIGTIGLIKGITTFKADKNVRLATYASRCIENEILMHFRSQKKLAGEVSLSDSLDSDGDGNSLSLMDVISVDDNMLEELDARDACVKVRRCVERCLDEREGMIITLRYGLGGKTPLTQREIAAQCGISRSYVSRRAYCKRGRYTQRQGRSYSGCAERDPLAGQAPVVAFVPEFDYTKLDKGREIMEQKIRTAWDEEQENWYFSAPKAAPSKCRPAMAGRERIDEISGAWPGMPARQYEGLKGLQKEHLGDNMSTMELVLNMLAEEPNAERSRGKRPEGIEESRRVAQEGGCVAGEEA